MKKINTKGTPLLLTINGELFGIEEIKEIKNTEFLTIKAINITGEKKLTIRIDPRLINVLKIKNKNIPYIH